MRLAGDHALAAILRKPGYAVQESTGRGVPPASSDAPLTPATPSARAPKYGNRKSGKYASEREAKRAEVLHMLAKCGEITELQEQVEFVLIPKQDGERAVTWRADFVYRNKFGELIVEDAKGVRTQQYVIRRKLMLLVHGIRIREV